MSNLLDSTIDVLRRDGWMRGSLHESAHEDAKDLYDDAGQALPIVCPAGIPHCMLGAVEVAAGMTIDSIYLDRELDARPDVQAAVRALAEELIAQGRVSTVERLNYAKGITSAGGVVISSNDGHRGARGVSDVEDAVSVLEAAARRLDREHDLDHDGFTDVVGAA